mgnify:FL=1
MFHIRSCQCTALPTDVPVGKGPSHQSGAIVWQAGPMGLQILLVERSSVNGWGIPKGSIELGSLWWMPVGRSIVSWVWNERSDLFSLRRTLSWSLDNDAQTGGPHTNAPEMNFVGAVTSQ